MEKIFNSKIFSGPVTTVVLVALIALFGIHAVNLIAEDARADLTADRLYSLSDGTREILAQMQQEGVKPIEVKLYFSETTGKTLPKFIKEFITYERYLEALLKEYAVASEGKVKVSFIDPVPDSDDALDAQDFGLDGKPINQEGDLFYFGLVFETQTGSRDAIAFLWPNQQETIEYEVTKRIHRLLWPARQRIGVMSSLEVLSDDSNPYMRQILAAQGKNPGDSWIAMKLLEESYEVSAIAADTDHLSHDDYDLVIVVHPKGFNDRTLWALDEWIATGGNTLIFLDPFALADRAPQNPQQPWAAFQHDASSNLGKLLAQWGLERPANEIAADFDLAVDRGPERLVVDLQITDEHRAETLNRESPVLQGLTDLRFFLAGVLQKTGDAAPEGVEVTPLITTTPRGSTLEIQTGFPSDEQLTFMDVNEPGKLLDRFNPGSAPVVLAYQVQGKLPPLFPDGAEIPGPTPPLPPGLPPGIQLPPQESDEVFHKDPVPEAERKEATVMVFADVDLISDQVAFQNTPFGAVAVNDNHKVLLNAVDYLFGSESLMKVRARKPVARPFTLFDEIERQADRQTLEREKELRAEIARFEEQLREKQSAANNQALFKKQLQDEVDELNDRIAEANRELREIRKEKRSALAAEEAKVRFATLGTTPLLVLALGLFLFFRRRVRDARARRSTP